jgi:hypothetical protein
VWASTPVRHVPLNSASPLWKGGVGTDVEFGKGMSSMTQNATLPTYGAIYAFGDSLSDAGNLSIVSTASGAVEPVSPPYYKEGSSLFGVGRNSFNRAS